MLLSWILIFNNMASELPIKMLVPSPVQDALTSTIYVKIQPKIPPISNTIIVNFPQPPLHLKLITSYKKLNYARNAPRC